MQELLEAIGVPYTGSGPAACMRCTDKVLAKHLMREAGIPTPGLRRLQGERDQRAGRRRGAAGHRASARLPDRRQAGQPGLGAGRQVRAHSADELPRAIVGAFSYDRKVLLERYVQGRDLAVSVLDARRRTGSP